MGDAYALFKSNPDPAAAPSLIEACISSPTPNLDMAFNIYKTLTTASQPGAQVYDALVKACVACKQYDRAISLWEEMYKHYAKPSQETFSLIAHACAITGAVVIAKKMFSSLKNLPYNAGALDCINLIRVFTSHGQFLNAIDVWNYMEYKGLANSPNSCIMVLDLCAELGYLGLGEQVHAFLLNHKLPQDIALTNSILNMYIKCGQPSRVLSVWDEINQRRPTTTTYVHVLKAYATMKNVEEAEKIIHFLTAEQREDSEVAGALIDVYAASGKHAEVITVFTGIKTWSAPLNTNNFVNIVNACAETSNFAVGQQVHKVVANDSSLDGSALYVPLLVMYIRCGQHKQVEAMWDAVMEHDSLLIEPSSYVALINACSNSTISMGDKIYSHIVSSGIALDLPLASALMEMYAKYSRVDKMHIVWQHLMQNQVEPDYQIYFLFLSTCAKCAAADIGSSILSQLERRSPKLIDSAILRVVVKMFHESQRPALVLLAWRRLNDVTQLSADSDTYELVLQACIATKNLDQGKAVVSHMRANGFVASSTLDAMTVALYVKCGDIGSAIILFEEMAGKHSSIDTSHCLTILSGCDSPESGMLGEMIHAYLVSTNAMNYRIATALQSMYLSANRYDVVMQLWNETFARQVRVPIKPYIYTLKACARTASLELGKSLHSHFITSGAQLTPDVFIALLEMYIHCAAMQEAVFLWTDLCGLFNFTPFQYQTMLELCLQTHALELGKMIISQINTHQVRVRELQSAIIRFQELLASYSSANAQVCNVTAATSPTMSPKKCVTDYFY